MKFVWGIIAIVVVTLAGTVWWVNATVDKPAGTSTKKIEFIVAKGEGAQTVAANLEKKDLIASARAWTLYLVTSGLRANLLPGEYNIVQTMTGREIAELLTSDDSARQEVTVKILEGSTTTDIADLLAKQGVMSAEDFIDIAAVKDSRTVVSDTYYEFLTDKPTTAGMEGFLFPDTYRFFQDATPTSVLRKFLDNFNAKLKTETRQQIKASGRTYFQTVILASILERELKTDVDRAMAADIFLRRLEAGIALQADATVLYALGEHKTGITSADLQVDSPYNTYKYPGLPPGPIGNPGVSALRAAANPTPNDYWYYLSGKDGKTHYAKTLDEHNENKDLYLR